MDVEHKVSSQTYKLFISSYTKNVSIHSYVFIGFPMDKNKCYNS